MLPRKLTIDIDEEKIDSIFRELAQWHLPGAAVGIAVDGRPIYRKGFGLANMELPLVLSPTMRMRIFSISKHFTSLAYMLLCEEGRGGIDDRVGLHLPELHSVARDVTMRQLMGNIGGLRDIFDICFQLSGTGWSVQSAELLSLYRDIDDVNAAPGTAWIYNNGGFLMLTTAIERITGQRLEDVLRERIFGPAGMKNTLLRRFDSDFLPNSATLHMTSVGGGYEKSYIGEAIAGEGGIVSTIDDMLSWLAHMDAPVVGTAATWDVMKFPQRLANGTSTGYGLGLCTGRYRGVETLHHAGGGMGGNSQMIKVPAAGLDVVIMVNREDTSASLLAAKILDNCLKELEPLKERPSHPFVCGSFCSQTTGRVLQLFGSAGAQVVSIDGMDMPVERDGDHVLRPTGTFQHLEQSVTLVGDPQKPKSVQVSDCGNLDELVRMESAEKNDAAAIAGRYRSDTIGTLATVSETTEGAQLVTVGRFGSATYRLESLGQDVWRAKSPRAPWLGGILSFGAERRGFRFSTYRTRALSFRREA